MLAQFIVGFFTAMFYLIAIFYSINDLEAILTSHYLFPLTAIYLQSTGSADDALGLPLVSPFPPLQSSSAS
jgi:choline transport protein